MIELGNYNTLTVLRATSVGLFLGDGEGTEILLPTKYVPESYSLDDDLEVFCYLDHLERPVATTINPAIKRDQFAFLRVAQVTQYGAFLDWGLEKHLLVPFAQQKEKMEEGMWYVIFCTMDPKSQRLIGSSKLNKFLSKEVAPELSVQEKVNIIVSRKTDLGWELIVNQEYKGLVFHNEVFLDVAVGDAMFGYVKNIRPDNKIDISLQPIGVEMLEPAAENILKALETADGFLALNDKSSPEDIKSILQISKKTFKKGVGILYKQRKIDILENGISLIKK